MKYSDLVRQVASDAEVSQSVAKKVMDSAMTQIKGAVEEDGEVVLNGVGKLVRKVRPARTGINPATKKKVSIPETVTVTFKVSKELKDILNA